jgi:hypothetical protein
MLLHQLGQDLVLALELGLQVGDLFVLGIAGGLAAFVVGGEGGGAALEELLLPVVEEGDGDAVLFADAGDGDFIEEVLAEQGDLGLRAALSVTFSLST